MTNHTPGPWCDAGNGLLEGADGSEVGVTPGWSAGNRALAKAAPDMYEALKTILGWRERDREDMAEIIRFIEDTASAALRKAEEQREKEAQ